LEAFTEYCHNLAKLYELTSSSRLLQVLVTHGNIVYLRFAHDRLAMKIVRYASQREADAHKVRPDSGLQIEFHPRSSSSSSSSSSIKRSTKSKLTDPFRLCSSA